MATVEELQAELSKRDEQIRGLSTKLQAHERVVKELGDAVERDAYGNPVSIRTEPERPTATPKPTTANGHPLTSFLGEGDYGPVDQYYQGLFEKQGYLTQKQLDQRDTALRQEMMGNLHLFRALDKTLANKDYAELGKYDSDLSKRTATVLQQNGWGKPLEGSDAWDKWQYGSTDALRIAADIAGAQLYKEAQAAAASTAKANEAQAATGLSPAPTATGGAGTPSGKPDFSSMKTPEEIITALDQASNTPAGAATG